MTDDEQRDSRLPEPIREQAKPELLERLEGMVAVAESVSRLWFIGLRMLVPAVAGFIFVWALTNPEMVRTPEWFAAAATALTTLGGLLYQDVRRRNGSDGNG